MDYTEVIDKLIQDHGFKQIEEWRSGYFGNFIITLENDDLLLRILRDRDFLSMEIASKKHKKWYDLAFVELLMNPRPDLINVLLFEEIFHFLENNYDQLRSLFSEELFPDTNDRMERLMKLRGEQLKQMWQKNRFKNPG